MCGEWKEVQFADLCEHSAFGPRFSSSEYATNGNVATLRTTDISADGRIEYRTMPVANLALSRFEQHLLKKDDLVVTRSGRVGTTAVFTEHRLPVLPGAFLIRFRLKRNAADPMFYRYFFNSADGQALIASVATGSVQQNVNITSLHGLRVPNPPLLEQRAIGSVLSALDDKIELNRRMNETLEAVARALFQNWFVDAIQSGLPKGWREGTLGDSLSVIETGGRPKGGIKDITEGVPSVGAESIVGIGHFDYGKTRLVPREFFDAMSKGHVRDGDVLLYKDGGRPGEFEPHVTMVADGFPFSEFSINEHVYRLRTEPALPQSFLFFWLSSENTMDEMRNRGTGVAIPGLNSTAVRELPILLPPASLLETFDERVSPVIRRIFANCNESRTLAALRNALLPKLLSGELRVPIGEWMEHPQSG
ncbi:MAG TPA: restriction endonuclease subunit S [Candidatus Binatia bacterium]|nr:restriction endonuclease subunit S [Candidatus Binatia bacterium]